VIGVIADDFTGATDVAGVFRREGLRTLLFFGQPSRPEPGPVDAIVIALKTRMTPADDAVRRSLAALSWLQEQHADQIYFKYCSTFDSTERGNIGPVLDALAASLGARSVLTTPSSPEHARTQYEGYLFVDDVLLAESPMREHPVTPMRDSSLARLLQAQTRQSVTVLRHATVRSGTPTIRNAITAAEARGDRYLLVDAIDADDLRAIGRAALDAPLLAGAAGLAGGLAAARAAASPPVGGTQPLAATGFTDAPAAVLSGSCSPRTLDQIAVLMERGHPGYFLDAMSTSDPAVLAAEALSWYGTADHTRAPVFYSSADQAELDRVQRALGAGPSARLLEDATGRIAVGLIERGVRRIVVAGGETSGAIVTALGVDGGLIGPEAAPGVPWIFATSGPPVALLLKSGNFGSADLLAEAVTRLRYEEAA